LFVDGFVGLMKIIKFYRSAWLGGRFDRVGGVSAS